MANPQPEPFVKFSRELLDAIVLSPMPTTHKEIVLAIIRLTYGDYGKKEAPISTRRLTGATGRDRRAVSRALAELVDEGVVRQTKPPSFCTPAVYRIRKDYEAWGKWSVPPEGGGAETGRGSRGPRGSRDDTPGGAGTPPQGEQAPLVVDIIDNRTTAEAVEELRRLEAYPLDEAKDAQLLNELAEEYPELDLKAEIRSWKLWLEGQPTKENRNYRLGLRNWIRKAHEFKGGDNGSGKHTGDSRKVAGAGRSQNGEW